MVVDAVMEHEAISGMVEVAIIKMKVELDSLLRRVQGVEVCNHASMTKFDRRLQEVEAMHSAKKSSDGAGTATSQPSVQKDIGRKGDNDGEGGREQECRYGGAYRGSGPTGGTATIGGDRRSRPIDGAGWGYSKRSVGKKRRILPRLGGAGRRIQPTGQTDGVHRRSKPIDGARWRYNMSYRSLGREDKSCWNTNWWWQLP